MDLLVDIGNTTIHYALYEKDIQILEIRVASNFEILNSMNYEKTFNIYFHKIKNCIISSVKPEFNDQISQQCQKYRWKHLFISSKLKSNIIYKVDQPLSIGSDLIATAVAAKLQMNNSDCIIIDMGTATTISCIKKNDYIGGSILPGMIIAANALISNTSLLKQNKWIYPKDLIARNTSEALNVGIIYGHILAIEGIISQYKKELYRPKIFLTGGNSNYVKDYFTRYHFAPNLIFNGMLYLKEMNLN